MLPRAPRVHIKYSCISQLKVNWLHNVKLDQPVCTKQKTIIGSPIVWNQASSYLCNYQSDKEIKKLDVHKLLGQHLVKNDLLIYPQISKDFLAGKTLFPTFHQKHNTTQNIFENTGMEFSLNVMYPKTSAKVDILNTSSDNTDKHKDCSKVPSHLPTDSQLDEMMLYFLNQAPVLFTTSGWSYSKCSYKILFENMMVGTKTESLNAYIMQINLMKNLTRIALSNPQINVVRMTKNLQDGTVHVRWQVQGTPRHLKLFSYFFQDEKRFTRYIDGFSIFYVENDGLYHRHILMNMTPMKREDEKSLTALFLARLGLEPGLESIPNKPAFPAFNEQRTS